MSPFTDQTIQVLHRLDKIWYKLDIDDKFSKELIEAANACDEAKFSSLLQQFEDYYRERVEKEIDRLRIITARWPLYKKQQISNRINQLEQSGLDRLKAIQMAYDELK